MATVELNGNGWEEFSKSDFAIIDCYGDHCVACVMLAPYFDAVADKLPGISFGRINVSKNPEIARLYNITSIPTLLFFRKGEKVHEASGSMNEEELLAEISNMLYN